MKQEEREKKNRIVAMASTAGIQAALLVTLFLLVAWRPPNPPLPEYGIELNFGLDTEGFGDVQPETPVGNDGTEAEQAAQEKEASPEEQKPEEAVEEKVAETKPVETNVEVPDVSSEEESPVIVKEKKVEEVKPPVEKPREKVEEKKAPEKKVEDKPKETAKEPLKAVYTPSEQTTATGTGAGGDKEGKPGNHGDDEGKVGDKGNPKGTLDAKALYGQPGGGGGGVSMSGFNGFDWPTVQSPTLPDEAFGVYEFMVKVDDQGDVISVTSLQRGLSLEAERKLKAMIQQLVFVPKGSNLPPQSEGKIIFRVVSR